MTFEIVGGECCDNVITTPVAGHEVAINVAIRAGDDTFKGLHSRFLAERTHVSGVRIYSGVIVK